MCIGFISDECDEWMIRGTLYCNEEIQDQEMNFLLDTGSEKTILSLADAEMFDIRYKSLPEYNRKICGSDGRVIAAGHLKGVGIALREASEKKTCQIEKCDEIFDGILIPDLQKWTRKSVIGRDVLRRYAIDPDVNNKTIYLIRRNFLF